MPATLVVRPLLGHARRQASKPDIARSSQKSRQNWILYKQTGPQRCGCYMDDAGMADDQSDQVDSLKRKRVHADEDTDASGQAVRVGSVAVKATGKPVLNTKALRSVLKGVRHAARPVSEHLFPSGMRCVMHSGSDKIFWCSFRGPSSAQLRTAMVCA